MRRDPARALKVLAAAAAIRARVGGEFRPIYRTPVWREGSRATLDDAIALAFGDAKPRPVSPSGLTEREVEVARLVADGLTNKAIAAMLQLSVRTVDSHVRHALTKLGLDNRTQLAAWTREHDR